jgi:hypothetical protein
MTVLRDALLRNVRAAFGIRKLMIMTKIRAELSKKNPLYVEKHAFLSAYHFALQYPEWKRQYADSVGSAVKAVDYDGMPHGSGTGDPTARIAMRSNILSGNIALIESVALTAGRDLAEYLLYAVTNEGVSYKYLRYGRCKHLGPIPCGKNEYYQMRRLFYYLLSKKMEERNVKS